MPYDQLDVLFNRMQMWAGLKHISSREILSDFQSMFMQITILNAISEALLKSVAQNVMSGFIITDLLPLCGWRLSYLLALNLLCVVTAGLLFVESSFIQELISRQVSEHII